MITLTTPYPDIPLEKQAIEAKKTPSNYWSDFILGKNNASMPCLVEGAEDWIREAYRSFYFNPRYIFKRLKHITSYDQVKKHVLAAIGVLSFKLR